MNRDYVREMRWDDEDTERLEEEQGELMAGETFLRIDCC